MIRILSREFIFMPLKGSLLLSFFAFVFLWVFQAQGNTDQDLHRAIKRGDGLSVISFLDQNDVERYKQKKWSLIHIAVVERQAEMIRVLVRKGIDINSRDSLGNTPLHWATKKGFYKGVVMLLDLGADRYIKNKSQSLPLHLAALRGHVDVVAILTEGFLREEDGASVEPVNWNVRNRLKNTPLHLAAQEGHYDMVEYLLEKGA